MTHYKLYSLHLGCGEPLAAQYPPVQTSNVERKHINKKPVPIKTSQVMGRKRK
jgi:hypothetical protein